MKSYTLEYATSSSFSSPTIEIAPGNMLVERALERKLAVACSSASSRAIRSGSPRFCRGGVSIPDAHATPRKLVAPFRGTTEQNRRLTSCVVEGVSRYPTRSSLTGTRYPTRPKAATRGVSDATATIIRPPINLNEGSFPQSEGVVK